jgi:hypothetical protein
MLRSSSTPLWRVVLVEVDRAVCGDAGGLDQPQLVGAVGGLVLAVEIGQELVGAPLFCHGGGEAGLDRLAPGRVGVRVLGWLWLFQFFDQVLLAALAEINGAAVDGCLDVAKQPELHPHRGACTATMRTSVLIEIQGTEQRRCVKPPHSRTNASLTWHFMSCRTLLEHRPYIVDDDAGLEVRKGDTCALAWYRAVSVWRCRLRSDW